MSRIRHVCQLIGGDALIDLIRQLKIRIVGLSYRFKRRTIKTQNCFITCTGKIDGIGAQVQAVFSTMLFAKEFGITYAHTPFDEIWSDHSSKEWENFFNLGKDEVIINEIDKPPLNVVHINHPLFISFKPNTLYIVEHCHSFVDSNNNAKLYSKLTDRFIEKYQDSSKEDYKSFYEVGKINIAIHVRRGDVSKTGEHSERYTDSLYYKYLLNNIKSILIDLKIDSSIHLYSQGNIDDFHELKGLDINYHLDECVFTTFNNLVLSDVIIMSKSTYSYSAALLSKAIIIYEPFWHKPLKDWIISTWNSDSKKATFDKLYLKQRLQSLKLNK
jgi:hypothetical protein